VTNEFAEACFFKPAEAKTNELAFTLAPLILQEVNGAAEPLSRPDRFGTLSLSNGLLALDRSRPAIYWHADTVRLKGNEHVRFAYAWCYSSGATGSQSGPGVDNLPLNLVGTRSTASVTLPEKNGTRWNASLPSSAAHSAPGVRNTLSSGEGEADLALQGIRITLNSAGQPMVWEVLADSSGADLIFVAQSLEAAALAEFGKALPARCYAIERSVEEAPNVVVARVIDDGPVAMGPFVYLSADTRVVSALICRCMPAQARKLLATGIYDLVPFQSGSTTSLIAQARALSNERTAFWPGGSTGEERLEKCLRLPGASPGAQGTTAR
jgi:hypothetical protein